MGDADEFRLEQGLLGNAIKGLLAGCVTAGSAAEKKKSPTGAMLHPPGWQAPNQNGGMPYLPNKTGE